MLNLLLERAEKLLSSPLLHALAEKNRATNFSRQKS
jgi:hypothetical protein